MDMYINKTYTFKMTVVIIQLDGLCAKGHKSILAIFGLSMNFIGNFVLRLVVPLFLTHLR